MTVVSNLLNDFEVNLNREAVLSSTNASRSYRDLLVWQKGISLVKEIYLVSEKFPREELYGLTSQIRRAAVSVPSNIAEGQGRGTQSVEFARYLKIALGSLAEVDTQLELAKELDYVKPNGLKSVQAMITDLRKMLFGLINSLDLQ